MKLSDVSKNYVFIARIEFPKSYDENATDEDDVEFVELREPNLQETKDIQRATKNDDDVKSVEAYEHLFPICLVKSSFTKDDGEPAEKKEVYAALKESGSLFFDILETWIKSCPFQQRLKKDEK